MEGENKQNLAYIIGVAMGDGNLSNPNGRAVRLRVTCDTQYPKIIENISSAIKELFPKNKVSIIKRETTYCDVSCYSNKWEDLLGWKAKGGSKFKQKISVPSWIKKDKNFSINCLRGLVETDGSVYEDRGYRMVNIVTIIPSLADDILEMIRKIGFTAKKYKIKSKVNDRYNIRLSKDVENFLSLVRPEKA